MKLALINGPNLNLLGRREPQVYGYTSLADIERTLSYMAVEAQSELRCMQSNSESTIIDFIHQQMNHTDGILINPGALTHTSIALRDALLGSDIPFVEIHISNVYARESFRHHSFLSDIAKGVIVGCGIKGYELGLQALIHYLNQTKES